jgi:prevent-host-death family protein
MATVNVTDLRQNLPAYLERARQGERIRVTLRGAVIAEITGPKSDRGRSRTDPQALAENRAAVRLAR